VPVIASAGTAVAEVKQGMARHRHQAGDSATGFIFGAGFGGLLAWWRRQIGGLLPGWARRRFSAGDAIIIDVWSASRDLDAATPATGQILVRRSGRSGLAAPLDFSCPPIARAASDTVILRLPKQLILRREITLPIAAERDLRAIIHSQMDRLTPFDASEVFWGASQPRREETRLRLTLHVVARSRIAWLLGRLADIGLEPSILQDGADGFTLARLGNRKNPEGTAKLAIRAALVLGCLLVPLISQQRRLQATEQRLEVLMPVQRQIMQLQARIADQAAVQSMISQTGQDTALRTLALLSAALPDGTWLSDIAMTGDRVAFDGQSSDAAQLIGALTATPGLRNVSFIEPVTRAPGGADVFSIQLAVAR
jgi:general secretion pathway protein L